MAYATSSATDADGVLDAFRIFAVAQGWTQNHWAAYDTGMWLNLSKGTAVFNLVSIPGATETSSGQIYTLGATSYDGGSLPTAQPGGRTDTNKTYTNDLHNGPFVSHHLFGGNDFIHMVVEVSSGRYTHLGIGILDKAGTYDGGEYCFGTKWILNSTAYSGDWDYGQNSYPLGSSGLNSYSSQVRFTENDLSGTDTYKDWVLLYTTPYSSTTSLRGCGYPMSGHHLAYAFQKTPNYFNGVAPLFPISVLVGRTDNLTALLGEPKEMKAINIYALTAGQEMILGSDTWMIFPVKQKGEQIAGDATPFSRWAGIAYKKVI